MKKIHVFLILSLVCVGLAGCDDETPQGVLGMARAAIVKGDFKAFKETLAGQAYDRQGNLENFNAARTEMKGKKLTLQMPDYASVKKQPIGATGFYGAQHSLLTYLVDVMDGNKVYKKITVLCEEYDELRYHHSPARMYDVDGGPYVSTSSQCRISNVE